MLEAFSIPQMNIAKFLLVEGKSNPNVVSRSHGFSCLHFATKNNSPELVSLLIKHGANLNLKSKPHEATALLSAAKKSFLEIAKILIRNGADWKLKNRDGKTPLTIAKTSSSAFQFLSFAIPR